MWRLRSARLLMLALLLALIPASSFAGVFISVGFAPPILPVYVQPICPDPGMMWTPGYWAYGPDGYFWVPGAWVPAPYVGALWTPPWWGWSGGLYVFHNGYWGSHVGYYGGVNYGFGYGGIGFAGGMWRGGVFAYNTAVMRVNTNVIRNTYVDRTVVERNTIVNNNHVSFNGGPGGINHAPTASEQAASHDQHMAPTSFQQSHANSAMQNRSSYAANNGGHPQNLAASRPLGGANRPAPSSFNARGSANGNVHSNNGGAAPYGNTHANTGAYTQQQHTMNQSRPAPEYHQAPQQRAEPQQQHAAPQQHAEPHGESHDHGHGR